MKKTQIILFSIFLLSTGLAFAQKKQPDSPDYKIKLSTEKSIFSLGEHIVIKVEYSNNSNRIWTLYRPDSSFYCSMAYLHSLSRYQIASSYAFNVSAFINIDPDCPECGFAVATFGDKITLNPDEKYVFYTDISYQERSEIYKILPGQIKIFYRDGFESIDSDTIEICLLFTHESVNYILERMEKEKSSKANIRWGVTILRDIYPNFKYEYSYWEYTKNRYKEKNFVSPLYYTKEQKIANKSYIKELKLYWEQNKNSEEMKIKIHKINTNFKKYYFMDMRRIKLIKNSCIDYNWRNK